MANYSIVVDSKFQPYSFQDLLAPALMSTKAHQEIEDAYGAIADKASIWEGMLNKDIDVESYKLQQAYIKELQKQRDILNKEGLSTTSRRDMLNLRSRYSKDIVPIEQAYAARAEEAKSQYAGRANGMVYEGDASTSSVDRYLKNPQIRYNMANSQEGFKRVATVASALSKELREYKRGKPLDKYVNTWLQKHGYESTDIDSAISDISKILQGDTNVSTNGVLRHILTDEMKVSGVDKWTNNNAKMDYFNRVAPALYQAVGQTQVSPFENYGAKLAAQEAMQKRLNGNNDNNTGHYRVNPMALRSSQEIDKANKELQSHIKNGYIKLTSRGLTITDKGMNDLRSNPHIFNPERPAGMLQSVKKAEGKDYSSFKEWYIKNIGGYNASTGKIETPTTRLNAYVEKIKPGSYDVYHSTEYDRLLDSSYGKDWTSAMWAGSQTKDGKRVVEGVEFSGKKGWSKTKYYTKEDLQNYVITNIRYSKHGNTAILQSTQGGKDDVIRVKLPEGIHTEAEKNVKRAIYNADYWGQIIDKGYRPKRDSRGAFVTDKYGNIQYTNVPLSYEDKIVIDNKREQALSDIYAFGSQIVAPSTTKDEEISPWY